MPIKFGDLIENANAGYALIDLTDNQSRGVSFINTVGSLTNPGGVSNAIYQGVTSDKRRQGMLLVIKDAAEVYILEGGPDSGTEYTDNYFGLAPGQAGSPWKVVGSLDLYNTNIDVNISDSFNGNGKTFGKYHPGFEQEIGGTNYVGVVPIEAWMAEAASGNSSPVSSPLGATALEIIVDALNEQFPLSPSFSVSFSDVPFNEQQVTSESITSITVPKANGVDITNIKYYWKETQNDNWNLIGELDVAQIDNNGDNGSVSGISLPNLTITADYYDFEGVSFKVEATDELGATGFSTQNKPRKDYRAPQISGTAAARQYQNSTFANNESDYLRVAGNVDSVITATITLDTSYNDTTIQNSQHQYQIWSREKINSTSYGAWTAVNSPTNFSFTNGTYSVTYAHAGAASIDYKSQEAQYKVVCWDAYTSSQVTPQSDILLASGGTNESWINPYEYSSTAVTAGCNSDLIKFRYPVFVGHVVPTDTTDIDGGVLSAVSETLEDQIVGFMTGASSLNPTDQTTPANNDFGSGIGSLTFPRLYDGPFPFLNSTHLFAFDNTIANGYGEGDRVFFAYADLNGAISMDDNANATITAVGNLQSGTSESQQLGAWIQHETGQSSGVDIHGRLTSGGAEYTTHSRKIDNVDYRICIMTGGNSITSDVRIKQ